jgi:hypothetical protein
VYDERSSGVSLLSLLVGSLGCGIISYDIFFCRISSKYSREESMFEQIVCDTWKNAYSFHLGLSPYDSSLLVNDMGCDLDILHSSLSNCRPDAPACMAHGVFYK